MAFTVQITFDAHDPAALAEFWALALGYELEPPPAGFQTWEEALDAWGVPAGDRNRASALRDPAGHGPRVFIQRVPEDKTAKNRLHLDLRAAEGIPREERMAALEQRAQTLVDAGATRVSRHEPDRLGQGHIVMQDPEGNEFCLD